MAVEWFRSRHAARRRTAVHYAGGDTARGLCTSPHPSADRAAPPRVSLRTRRLFAAYPAATPPFTEHGDICTPPRPSADRAAPPGLSLRTRGLFTAYPAATPPFTEHGDICTSPHPSVDRAAPPRLSLRTRGLTAKQMVAYLRYDRSGSYKLVRRLCGIVIVYRPARRVPAV